MYTLLSFMELAFVILFGRRAPLKKTATITVRCTEDMRAKLTSLARADRRTVSLLVEILLEQALQRIDKSGKKRIAPERQSQ
jgi:hypothetical protein